MSADNKTTSLQGTHNLQKKKNTDSSQEYAVEYIMRQAGEGATYNAL